jgi:hypothetical protein
MNHSIFRCLLSPPRAMIHYDIEMYEYGNVFSGTGKKRDETIDGHEDR